MAGPSPRIRLLPFLGRSLAVRVTCVASRTRALLALGSIALACGGISKHEGPSSAAGAPAFAVDSGVEPAAEPDAAPDAAGEVDAGLPAPCPSQTETCCDSWTGERSTPNCESGMSACGAHQLLQSIDSECTPTPAVCHVESLQQLEGKACPFGAPSCSFGKGFDRCECYCPESSLVWWCGCTLR